MLIVSGCYANAVKIAERPIHAYGQVMHSSYPTTEKFGLQPETGTPESSAQSSFQGKPQLQLKTHLVTMLNLKYIHSILGYILQCWLMNVHHMKTAMMVVQMIVILYHWNELRQFYCKLLLGTILVIQFLAVHQQHMWRVATSDSWPWHSQTSFVWGQAADRDRERQTHKDCLDSVLRSLSLTFSSHQWLWTLK